MPTLHWIGKEKVVNHHRDVPFRVLEHQYKFIASPNPSKGGEQNFSPVGAQSGGAIIHGDNLEALKSLLPEYEGRVKCIYIDPPYNTGNEGWVYNDNVNDPKIRKWLHSVVGREGEDLSRHDKWLCMMYPRLMLLHKLLANDGAIFISIDDNEQANLKLICDEIFGAGNFIANICWQKKQSPQNDAINFSDMHDFIIVYAKNKKSNRNDFGGWNRNLISKSEKQIARYKNPDNDPRGNWTSVDCTSNKNRYERPNLFYPIINPLNQEIYPPENTVWRYERDTFKKLIAENRIWFGTQRTNFPRFKRFSDDVAEGVVPSTWWIRELFGDNQLGRRQYRAIFSDVDLDFATPKPTLLLENIFQISSDKDSIILDSFAGSGTTAHAVLNLNKQDGGNRKFILIEMEDYAETITAERMRRVMNGYGEGNKTVEGTGGSFDYYTLGEPLFTDDHLLNELVGEAKIRQYVWFTETHAPMPAESKEIQDSKYLLGLHNGMAYYFVYEAELVTTLDYDLLAQLKTSAASYLIYADNCLLPKEYLDQNNIVFKKIPRDISRF